MHCLGIVVPGAMQLLGELGPIQLLYLLAPTPPPPLGAGTTHLYGRRGLRLASRCGLACSPRRISGSLLDQLSCMLQVLDGCLEGSVPALHDAAALMMISWHGVVLNSKDRIG